MCSVCGHVNDAGDRFCGNCGSNLESDSTASTVQGPAPAETELRFVSVLFADLVGYTTLSEHADAEDVREMLTRYFERSRDVIESFGGTVDKFIGDAVMGVWGATHAREDDAERAVRAALELVQIIPALGDDLGIPDLVLRAGVDTGSTAVGPGGNEKGLVVGDLVNTASRLQSIAEPGTVFVGRPTYELTERAIDYETLGDRVVKGKEEPVSVFRAVRVASMVGGSDGGLRAPPFVGRQRELRLLKDTLDLVGRERRARLVSIVGEAGIGKSRLVEEFKHQIDGYSRDVFWHQGRSPSYGDGVTYWAVGEMIRRRAGIVEDEPDTSARTRLRTMLTDYVAGAEDRAWIESRLAGLLGLAQLSTEDSDQLSAAIRLFFQNVAERGSTVLVFEDFHWADTGLLDLVADLVERSIRSPILVVTVARTDLLDRVPSWGSGRRSSLAVRLDPLPDDEMTAMLTEYLPGLDPDVVAAIATRAAGFPLYAVEFVRMLTNAGRLRRADDGFRLDGDVASIDLPDSLRAVIGARIDRLDAADRSVLQDASVLGQTFTARALASLRPDEDQSDLEPRLARLIALEVLELEDDPVSPERGQYGFVQSLIREVVYKRLNRDERRTKHLAAAQFFGASDDPELAAVVAGHFTAAVTATPAGSERTDVITHAVGALADAARRAADLGSHGQSLDLTDQVLGLVPDREDEIAVRLDAIESALLSGDITRGLAHANALIQLGDDDTKLRAIAKQAALYVADRRAEEALRVAQPAYEALDAIDTPPAVEVAAEAARAMMLHGMDEAADVVDRLLPAAEELGLTRVVFDALITKATVLGSNRRFVEARALFRGVADQARDAGSYLISSRALNNLSASMRYELPHDEAVAVTERLIEDALRAGAEGWVADVRVDASTLLASGGDYEGAVEMLELVDPDTLSTSARGGYRASHLHMEAVQSDPAPALQAFLEQTDEWSQADDPQQQGNYDIFLLAMYQAAGEWGEIIRVLPTVRAMGNGYFSTEAMWEAATAAAWLGDRTVIADIRRRHETDPSRYVGFDHYLDGLDAALRGDVEHADAAFRDLFAQIDGVLAPALVVMAQVAYSLLMRSDSRRARDAGSTARAWLRETGSGGLLSTWSEAFEGLDGEPEADVAAAAG